MVIFKKKNISNNDILLVFAACVFPIHLWSIINLLQVVPAWILRATVWELAGVVAYTQIFALTESALVFSVLLLLGLVLPYRLYAHKFVALSTALIILNSAWFIFIQYTYDAIRTWNAPRFLFLIAVYLLSLALTYWLVWRSNKLEMVIEAAIKRVAVLSFVYVALSVFSFFIVVVRNL